jgi:hypothetical protein
VTILPVRLSFIEDESRLMDYEAEEKGRRKSFQKEIIQKPHLKREHCHEYQFIFFIFL